MSICDLRLVRAQFTEFSEAMNGCFTLYGSRIVKFHADPVAWRNVLARLVDGEGRRHAEVLSPWRQDPSRKIV